MGKILTGLLVGVFVGAVAYEVLKKTEIVQKTARKVARATGLPYSSRRRATDRRAGLY